MVYHASLSLIMVRSLRAVSLLTLQKSGGSNTQHPAHIIQEKMEESSVKVVKGLMKKAQDGKADFHQSLIIHRSAPLQNGLSPAQMLMGRWIRTNRPILEDLLTPKGAHKVKVAKINDCIVFYCIQIYRLL